MTELSGSTRKLRRNLLLILVFAVLLVILWIIYININVFPMADFAEYWASGRLNLTGGNPYAPGQMLVLEKTVGWNENEALMMLNPPWTLSYVMLFGLLDYSFSRFLCFLIQIGIVFLCSILLWEIYQGDKKNQWIAWVVILTFGPILHALRSGQVTILVLLGSVGFLYYINRKSDFWAGVLASMVFVKPHLLYLFIVVLFFWAISRHRYKVIFGLAIGLVASLGIALLVNHQVVSQYINMLRFYPLDAWKTSTLGSYVRLLLGIEKYYLQFLPSLIGVFCFLAYWRIHKKDFEWTSMLPFVILISIVTTPYGWTLDYSVLVISVIQVAALFGFSNLSFNKIIILTTYWIINFILIFVSASQNWFWWFPSFLLIWYLLALKYLTRHNHLINKNIFAITLEK
jgi:hypothetical protein